MSGPHHREAIPKPALYAGVGLVALALVSATAGRIADFGAVREPDAAVALERDLRFEASVGLDALSGEIAVIDVATGEVAAKLADEGDGFIRGVLRALARDRALGAMATDAADTRLTLWSDGRLSIRDLGTDQQIELTGFGADNRAAFEALLRGERKS